MIYIIEYILGAAFILYGISFHFTNPGTFLSAVFAFNNVWIVLGSILIFLASYRKRHSKSFWTALKKWQKIIAASLFSLGLIVATVNLCFIFHPDISKSPDADIVILLGGGIDKNGNLPESVKARVDVTAEYLKTNPDAIVVATGGSLKNLPEEAPAIMDSLIEKGIEPDRILIENHALDTIQNFKYSAQVLSEYKNCTVNEILESDILVVTSFFHLSRAQRIARRLGFTKITGLASKTSAFKILNSYGREICAHIKLNLRILFTGEPKSIAG